ncbi:MAG: Rab family GTPase [Candidatus Thorarchaeota archaeon]
MSKKLAPTDVHERFKDTPTDFGLKVVMMGDGAVGKTSLVLRYTQNTFSPEYKQSLGASFAVKDLEIQNQHVKLVIWDVAGQPSFRQVRRHYYSGAHGALLVFDVTKPESFMTLHNWYNDFRRVVPQGVIILIGNKVDLKTERLAPPEAAQMLQKWWNIPYIETSAATATGVSNAFRILATNALDYVRSHRYHESESAD